MKKATKIIGAVLGVLLVAALFTGAAAAADNEKSLGDVYVWKLYETDDLQPFPIDLLDTEWSMGEHTVKFVKDPNKDSEPYCYISGENTVPGTYTHSYNGDTYTINVKLAEPAPTGSVYKDTAGSKAIAELTNAKIETTRFVKVNEGSNIEIAWTNPDGFTFTNPTAFGITKEGDYYKLAGANDFGEYTLKKVFHKDTDGYSSVAPNTWYGEPLTFTIYKEITDKSLDALSDYVLQGNLVTVALTAPYNMHPGYLIEVEKGEIPAGQPDVILLGDEEHAFVKVGLDGVATFVVKSTSTDNLKVKLMYEDRHAIAEKSITIKVKAGTITADSESATTFIGNEVDLSGSNELGGLLHFYIKGPNFAFGPVLEESGAALVANGKEWEATVKTETLRTIDGKKPDAGNYTIYVAKLKEEGVEPTSASDLDDENICDAYTTVVVALKQPFINITDAPTVVVKGDHLIVDGTAEGKPTDIMYYIFGTNYFRSATETVNEDGVFEIDEEIPDDDDTMQAGQYFLVIQHMMYDKKYNLGPVGYDINGKFTRNANAITGYYIVKNENGAFDEKIPWGGDPEDLTVGKIIFDTNIRQSANAAQALCDALDDQNIDDMYVKASFIVAGKTSVINPIPEQITKGQDLVITGVAVGHKNEVVTAELLSTAFAAVPKETVGSASFVTMSTRIDENGLWTITIDTSDLNADDYTVSVSVGQLDPVTQKIKIVEGTVPQPTAQPTTQPTAQPTVAPTTAPTQTPASPGFGILAALAGLGAVAVLLLRRQ